MAAPQHKLVILGAGFGGISAARAVEDAPAEAAAHVDATLIGLGGAYTIGAFNTLVLGGRTEPATVTREVSGSSLRLERVAFVDDVIVGVDVEAKKVVTRGGEYAYDDLIVSLGLDYDTDKIPGLSGAYNLCKMADMVSMRDAVCGLTSGRVVISVMDVPYKCPPLPYETAFIVDALLREQGVRDAVEVVVTTPHATAVPMFAPHVFQGLMEEQGIVFKTQTKVQRVEPMAKTVVFEGGESLEYAVLGAVFPQRATQVVAGMFPDASTAGVEVDPATLRSEVPGVYVIGDNARLTSVFDKAGAKKQPKAGKFAINHAKAAVSSVLADAAAKASGEELDWAAPSVFLSDKAQCNVETPGGTATVIDLNFYASKDKPVCSMAEPSAELLETKIEWLRSLDAQWFGVTEPGY